MVWSSRSSASSTGSAAYLPCGGGSGPVSSSSLSSSIFSACAARAVFAVGAVWPVPGAAGLAAHGSCRSGLAGSAPADPGFEADPGALGAFAATPPPRLRPPSTAPTVMPPPTSAIAASAIHVVLRDGFLDPRVTWPADTVEMWPSSGCCGGAGAGVGGRAPCPDQLDGGGGAQLPPGGCADGGVTGRH